MLLSYVRALPGIGQANPPECAGRPGMSGAAPRRIPPSLLYSLNLGLLVLNLWLWARG